MTDDLQLSESALRQLQTLVAGPKVYCIGSSTLQGLERQQLIRSRHKPGSLNNPKRIYSLTDDGKAALGIEPALPKRIRRPNRS